MFIEKIIINFSYNQYSKFKCKLKCTYLDKYQIFIYCVGDCVVVSNYKLLEGRGLNLFSHVILSNHEHVGILDAHDCSKYYEKIGLISFPQSICNCSLPHYLPHKIKIWYLSKYAHFSLPFTSLSSSNITASDFCFKHNEHTRMCLLFQTLLLWL